MQEPSAQQLGHRRLLVAGGDELARTMIAMRLRRAGHDVVERTTGEHAARLVLKDPHHVAVVLVGELPDGTPGAFAAWLREDGATRGVPLVVIVPRHRAELAAAARSGGADAVLLLPVAIDEVIRHVAAVVPATALAA